MIINGGSRSNARFFAKHLMRADENERVHIVEMRGLGADTLPEAFHELRFLASPECKNFFYHANLNPREGEQLNPAQWEQAVDALEHELHLDNHARFIVEHEKEGRVHRHVIWSRVDPDTLTATSDSNNYAAHERAARALETAFGHARTQGVHVEKDGPRPERRPDHWETFRGHQSAIDPQKVKAEVTALWHAADSGRAFQAALEESGFLLCKGDRRDFCIVDPAGDEHSLARRIQGAKAADIRERMADIDRDTLPSVDEARETARERYERIDPPAEKIDAPAAPERNTGGAVRELSKLEQFAQTMIEVMGANDGEPMLGDGLTWWERAAERAFEFAGELTVQVMAAAERATEWAKDQVDERAGDIKDYWQTLIAKERKEPDTPKRDAPNAEPEMER